MSSRILDNPNVPRYVKLAEQFRQQVVSGELKPGDRLPSMAEMKAQYGISQNTMERVRSILEKDGLIVCEQGRGTFVSMPRKPPLLGVIGVVSAYISKTHPYYANLLAGIQDEAHQNGFEVLLMQETAAVSGDKVDGVLVHGIDTLTSHFPVDIPRVSMIIDSDEIPSVTTDDATGIRDSVKHLLELGHRRIGFLSAGYQESGGNSSQKRVAAYWEALRAAGIERMYGLERNLESWDIALGNDGFRGLGRRKMDAWLQDGFSSLGCTAILAQNDDTAIGMIEALLAAGYRVPQDVSVIGFDGTERTDYFPRRLTTVEIPLESISRCGVELLVKIVNRRFQGEEPAHNPNDSIVLPTTLRVGDSTGPPPH